MNIGGSGGKTTAPGCPHKRNFARATAKKSDAVSCAASPSGKGSGSTISRALKSGPIGGLMGIICMSELCETLDWMSEQKKEDDNGHR